MIFCVNDDSGVLLSFALRQLDRCPVPALLVCMTMGLLMCGNGANV